MNAQLLLMTAIDDIVHELVESYNFTICIDKNPTAGHYLRISPLSVRETFMVIFINRPGSKILIYMPATREITARISIGDPNFDTIVHDTIDDLLSRYRSPPSSHLWNKFWHI